MGAPGDARRSVEDPGHRRPPVPLLGDLAETAVVVGADEPVQRVERLFDDDPALRHVVLRSAGGFHLVDRLHLDHLRRGRPLYARRLAQLLLADMDLPEGVVLPDSTPVDQAAVTVLGRDATDSLEVVLCVDPQGTPGVVPVRRLFESLSRTFAQASVHDPLTGLPNRLHLMHLLDRRAPATPSALLYVDLDRFKDVNDGYGHAAGDAVLVEFAARMRACCRAEDVVLRLGGDEFAVLVPAEAGEEALLALAGRVVSAAAAPFQVPLRGPAGEVTGTATVHVGASVGVASRPADDGEDALGTMLAQADAAMYLAKEQGRGTVRTFEDARRVAEAAPDDRPSRHTMERRLREALAGGPGSRLHLVYQPIVRLPSREVVALEALARWDDDELGAVPPDRFVPVAEAGGLILDLGRWALREACLQAAAWGDGQASPPSVSVNVSPLQLVDPGFEHDVLAALELAGLPADRLVLEITEAAGVDDLPRAAAVLAGLRACGVAVSLDDFGAGRSSLTLLRRLPVDTVKVDRALVAASAETTADALLLRLLVDACHGLRLRVCTEGVETEEQALRVTRLGVDAAQGWRFGHPLPPHLGAAALPAGPAQAVRPAPVRAERGATSEFVVATDDSGLVTFASVTVFEVLGLLPSDLLGHPFDDVVHPADRTVRDGVDGEGNGGTGGGGTGGGAEGGGGGARERTVRVRHGDGSLRWVLLRPAEGSARLDPGPGASVLLRCRDVTPVVEAEQRLREAEETFRLVFDAAPSAMALSGLDGVVHRVNAAFAALLDRTPESLVGVSVEDITWPEDREVDRLHLGQHRQGGTPTAPVRKRYTGRDGRPVPVEVLVSLVRSSDGRPTGVVAHVRPTTPPA